MSENSVGLWLAVVATGAVLSGCSEQTPEVDTIEADTEYISEELGVSEDEAYELLDSYGDPESAIAEYEPYREPFDEYAARDEAEAQLASEGYDYRYGCTDDCSGHEAGWNWRGDHGYSTPGKSDSFDEGGRAFDEALEERVEEMRDEYESGEEPY